MYYNLPSYPTNRLEALIHLDGIARAMIAQHDGKLDRIQYQGTIIPIGEMLHVGTMVMTGIKLLTQFHPHHYTIVYDPRIISGEGYILINDKGKFTTSFGHHIRVDAQLPHFPAWINHLCCMIQLYDSIDRLTVMTYDQDLCDIDPDSAVLWIAGNLHDGLLLEESLIQDETALSKLMMGHLDDRELVCHDILMTLTDYYHIQQAQYRIIPVSYHNTALLDGQKDRTSGYCMAMIV